MRGGVRVSLENQNRFLRDSISRINGVKNRMAVPKIFYLVFKQVLESLSLLFSFQ